MNSERWMDIYKRQPLPVKDAGLAERAAFLQEIQLDDFEMEREWNEIDRRRIKYTAFIVLLNLPQWGSSDRWTWIIWDLLLVAGMLVTWWHGRRRGHADRDYGEALLERIARVEKLIGLRRTQLRFEMVWAVAPGVIAGFTAARMAKDFGHGPAAILGSAVTLGALVIGFMIWLVVHDNRRKEVGFQQRLQHLRRVRARLLDPENDSTISPLSS